MSTVSNDYQGDREATPIEDLNRLRQLLDELRYRRGWKNIKEVENHIDQCLEVVNHCLDVLNRPATRKLSPKSAKPSTSADDRDQCCGACYHFVFENLDGYGVCSYTHKAAHCGDLCSCEQFRLNPN
jgi:hypothetical protein